MARLAAAAAAAAVAVAVVAEAGVLPTVEWDAELDVFELLERRGEPFLLTNSPTQRWSAHAAWAASPAELLDEAGEALLAKGVRATERSSSEFLYFNDDKEAVPYLQNEAWWLQAPSAWLESRGTAHPHPDASKNLLLAAAAPVRRDRARGVSAAPRRRQRWPCVRLQVNRRQR